MKYELSESEIDIISFALKNRINYLEGMIILNEQFMKKNPEQLAIFKTMLRQTKDVQERTTYIGQPEELK